MFDDLNYEDLDTMYRLKYKGKLIVDTLNIFEEISKKQGVLVTLKGQGKKFKKKAIKDVNNDFSRGLKNINKNIPNFVELPKLQREGDTQYSETSPAGKKEFIVPDLQCKVNQNSISSSVEGELPYDD